MSQIKSSRREKAAATRRAIVRAAHAEFVEQGFHGATVTAIAKRAGVAPQTVYFVFSNKSALISAAIDTAVMGEEAPTEPQLMPWFAAMLAEPDAAESLRIFVRGSADIFVRAAGLAEVLRAAALTDEEVRRTHLSHEQLREDGFRQVVDMLAGKGALRDGLTPRAATDVLLTVLGDSTYHLLTTERGWSHDQVVDWWTDTLPNLLLAG
ncbi:transcription regulator, TetR family [Nocardioides sp. CF8]|uniref:TetR/AcrR family transcriptional regulator n=1 Tax=Nocardioides sp. CF8 TaxID=110319 RepID=UPI00032EA407|nr:TetR/AcrR family transcriptional regulator [Nocardioides sp. CF8]EON22821.1 transcription regulator, TetR family [Nocardioides sp. CF8]